MQRTYSTWPSATVRKATRDFKTQRHLWQHRSQTAVVSFERRFCWHRGEHRLTIHHALRLRRFTLPAQLELLRYSVYVRTTERQSCVAVNSSIMTSQKPYSVPQFRSWFKVEGSEIKAQLLLALAWFHGIVQERRIFMPQGWTKEYDFSVGDLRCG